MFKKLENDTVTETIQFDFKISIWYEGMGVLDVKWGSIYDNFDIYYQDSSNQIKQLRVSTEIDQSTQLIKIDPIIDYLNNKMESPLILNIVNTVLRTNQLPPLPSIKPDKVSMKITMEKFNDNYIYRTNLDTIKVEIHV